MGRTTSNKLKIKNSKRKIPKNLDIEEFVDKEERKRAQEEKQNKDNVQAEKEKQAEFKETLKVEEISKTSMDKKLQNVFARKDAQLAQQRRKEDMMNAIRRMEEQAQEQQR